MKTFIPDFATFCFIQQNKNYLCKQNVKSFGNVEYRDVSF